MAGPHPPIVFACGPWSTAAFAVLSHFEIVHLAQPVPKDVSHPVYCLGAGNNITVLEGREIPNKCVGYNGRNVVHGVREKTSLCGLRGRPPKLYLRHLLNPTTCSLCLCVVRCNIHHRGRYEYKRDGSFRVNHHRSVGVSRGEPRSFLSVMALSTWPQKNHLTPLQQDSLILRPPSRSYTEINMWISRGSTPYNPVICGV